MGGGRRGGGGGGGGRGRGRSNGNGGRSSGGRRRNGSESLFVEGGFLSDWSFTPTRSRGKNPSLNKDKSGSKSGSFDRTKAASAPKSASRKSGGNNIGYQYPSVDFQESLQPESLLESNNEDNNLDNSHTFSLVDSKQDQIFAYVDQTPSSRSPKETFTYEYGYSSDFVLGDSSHRGLGFSDELERIPSGVEGSLKQMEEKEDLCFNSLSSEQEMNAKERSDNEVGITMGEETPAVMLSPKRNSGFLSIGGLKLFTQDISDQESDEGEEGESADEGSSESSEPGGTVGSSESDDSESTTDSDSDVDEEVIEDYLEGIGGQENLLNAKWLAEQEFDESDDDTSSSSGYDETVKKLGGIALQEASQEYGMKKARPRQKYNEAARVSWSSTMDDFMLVKDPRTLSAKKTHVARFPQSWPSGAQKSKSSRNFPGAKKKHRKEMVAVKRRERMLRRGVDLEEINLILEQIVSDGVDIYSFQRMHSRDCSQVRRLAAIYRLQSGCQGSGKKRFVTVTRTQHTCMPSSSDRDRLEKLIGAGMEDADFSVVECSNMKSVSVSGDGKRSKKVARGNALSPQELGQSTQRKASANRHGGSNESRKNKKKDSYVNQPVSFISSGVMQSETVEVTTVDSMETDSSSKNKSVAANFGAFEVHTKGFGSKMMAKMGFVEGGGLGKDNQGIAKPIEVIQRPKSLGLGVDFSNTTIDDAGTSYQVSRKPLKNKSQRLGSFEKHTKGFGSKMMAKMGFVEGMGLGRDSQGMVNPLVANRLPKSRGLGAKG